MSYVQNNQIISYVATGAAATLNVMPSDSGKTFLIPALGAAHALLVNLPAVQAGLKYRFMATATLLSAVTLTPTNGANGTPVPYTAVNGLVTGSLFNIANATASAAGALGADQVVNSCVVKAAANTAQLTADATGGSYIDINSDGVAWYVSGMSSATAGLA
jgi:hypothetical protein